MESWQRLQRQQRGRVARAKEVLVARELHARHHKGARQQQQENGSDQLEAMVTTDQAEPHPTRVRQVHLALAHGRVYKPSRLAVHWRRRLVNQQEPAASPPAAPRRGEEEARDEATGIGATVLAAGGQEEQQRRQQRDVDCHRGGAQHGASPADRRDHIDRAACQAHKREHEDEPRGHDHTTRLLQRAPHSGSR